MVENRWTTLTQRELLAGRCRGKQLSLAAAAGVGTVASCRAFCPQMSGFARPRRRAAGRTASLLFSLVAVPLAAQGLYPRLELRSC